jgi:shikimate kinase
MIGTGKTTIAKRLADMWKRPFYDLDQEMDRMLGHSFHQLVAEKGWVAFRELEYDICKRFAQLEHAVIALGGGTVRYAWNMDVLRYSGLFVLLKAPLADIVARVRRADRPRVHTGTTLEQDVHAIWSKEKAKYYAAADIVYSTGGNSIDQAVADIDALVAKHLSRSE